MLDKSKALVLYPQEYVEELDRQLTLATEAIEARDSMRPIWAMGYTSDSVAAQATAAALSEIWELLGVDNQTNAVQKIQELINGTNRQNDTI